MEYKIFFAESIKKDLKNIPKNEIDKIKLSISELKSFPNISNIKKLKAHPLADYRLRIGNYRVLFDVNEILFEINVLKIGHRKDIYD